MTTSNQIDLDIKIIRKGFIQKKWFTFAIPLAGDKRETTEIQYIYSSSQSVVEWVKLATLARGTGVQYSQD